MTTLYQPFEAVSEYSYNGKLATTTVNPNPLPPNDKEVVMMVRGDDEWVYITKAQAMAFFGLVEPVKE